MNVWINYICQEEIKFLYVSEITWAKERNENSERMSDNKIRTNSKLKVTEVIIVFKDYVYKIVQ